MRKMINKNNLKILLIALLSTILAFLFVFLLDFDLIKSIYNIYYGNSEVITFFKEQGENVFTNEVRVSAFKLTIYRFIYSVIPIAVGIFFFFYYRSKKLSSHILEYKIFKDNPSLGGILNIFRYLIGMIFAFLVINYKRNFFDSTFHNCLIGYSVDYVRIIVAVFLFLLPVIDWRKFIKDLKSFQSRHKKITNLTFVLFISIISFCLVEFQIGSKTNVFTYLIHINIMYWTLFQFVFLGLFRNAKPGAIVSLLFSYIIGLANDVVYQFRGNYIMFGDLTVIRTALEVAGNYRYHPNVWFWISIFLLFISLGIVFVVKLPSKAFDSANIHKRIISTILFESLLSLFILVSYKSGDFYGKVFGLGWDYNENVSAVGYLPYFFSNMDSTTRVVVEGYSPNKIDSVLGRYSDYDIENDRITFDRKPNIILIQNEAFSDISISTDIETDVDYMPYIHGLKENTQKGFMNMSITGGPTANSEFEVLTRTSLLYFPYGCVPYTQYLKQSIPSLIEALNNQSQEYNTVAYHSYYSSGYNRNSVYDYIGFDNKYFENNFLEKYPESDLPRGFMSDRVNYERVIKLYEDNKNSGNPFFCFNVTIQGHGGYSGGPYNLGEKVNVTNFKSTDSINTYLSNIKLSDTAFKGLVDYFSKVDEPTIIVMYGDHQPKWDEPSHKLIKQHPAWEDSDSQTKSSYYVPYIIWANYDIEEIDNLGQWNGNTGKKLTEQDIRLNTLSPNYLGSLLLYLTGNELSDYDRFLLDLHEEYPAISAVGIWDKNGNYYPNASSTDSERIEELNMIQYNLIFDKEDKKTDRFLP